LEVERIDARDYDPLRFYVEVVSKGRPVVITHLVETHCPEALR
jgi:hypothetical protein